MNPLKQLAGWLGWSPKKPLSMEWPEELPEQHTLGRKMKSEIEKHLLKVERNPLNDNFNDIPQSAPVVAPDARCEETENFGNGAQSDFYLDHGFYFRHTSTPPKQRWKRRRQRDARRRNRLNS